MKKPRKPLSELQKANLLTGQLLRDCYNTERLVRLLRQNGQNRVANEVECGLILGKKIAWDRGRVAIRNAKLAKLAKLMEEASDV